MPLNFVKSLLLGAVLAGLPAGLFAEEPAVPVIPLQVGLVLKPGPASDEP